MRNFRFAVVAGAALLFWSGGWAAEEMRAKEPRRDRELAQRFVGSSLHWELRGQAATLVFVSEDSVWWISDAIRGGFSHGDAWYPVSEDEVVCYLYGIDHATIRFQGDRFTMQGPFGQVKGEVLWRQP
jgi:hypothetical protein